MIVSEVPGTTRDSIDTVLERGDTTFVLVDTAGLRRKRRQRQGIEYYSELRALEAAERADVALVLVDASEGVVEQDLAVADVARKAGCATAVVLSKWDIAEVRIEDVKPHLASKLRQRPPVIAVSAKTGRGLERLLDLVEDLFRRYTARIPTPELNRALQELREARQPPGRGRTAPQPPLRHADLDAAAALPHLRQRPRPRDPRLRLLGRERAAATLWARGRARLDRLRDVRMKAVVVGAGSWGSAFAALLRDRGHEVTLAARDPEQAEAIRDDGPEPALRPATPTSRGIATSTIEDAPYADAELVVVAVPSAVFGEVVAALPGTAPVLSLTKGLDPATGERLSTLVRGRPVAVLSGPNIAEEIVRGLPAAAVVASDDLELAVRLQLATNSTIFRVYVNDDIAGVELCAAAKNVIALAAGGADGLRLGDNAKAALVARGLAEMRRLAEAAGARPDTFAGLAGMGDLIVTCWAPTGRNRRAGELIAQGSDARGGRRARSAWSSRG